MRSISSDNGVDIILDILRQSQIIKANLPKNENNKALETKEINDDISHSPRASIRRADTDKDIMLSRKERHINQRKNEEEYNKTKGIIESILNRMTARDYMKLSEEGFKAEDLTIEALTLAVELIKDYEGSSGVGIDKGIDIEKEQLKSIKSLETNELSREDIKKAMEAENLPIKSDSVDRINVALKLSEGIPQMDKKDILFLLNKELAPTIENLYKARYSNQSHEASGKLSDGEWKKLIPQVSEILEDIDIVPDNEILEDARWLIENDIPLTEDNMNLLTSFKALRTNYSKDIVFDRILKGMKEGVLPGDVVLIERVNSSNNQISHLSAKRQLEEIRLKMTLEAAMLLEKKGIHIETEHLERAVERLRLEEEAYFKELYIEEAEEADFKLLQLTSESMDEIKTMPIHVLGATLGNRKNITVSGLLEAGRSIVTELDKAKEAYETFFTIPRAEYGDSIKKAFSNATSLMEEMGIENTDYNHRAIRILGYNRMEITHESIEQVKAYDLRVNYLIQNLNPGVAVQIIKERINPMELPIAELNRLIEHLNEEGYTSLDKYSSYLYKLEKEEGISEDERKAYIGIYRLLYQIDKSDGAALGALIKSNQEITLNHLLTALRTNKKGEMDYKIDDEYGILENRLFKGESISDQVGSIFSKSTIEDISSTIDTYLNEPNVLGEVQEAVIKELLNSLTPNKLQQLHSSILNTDAKSGGQSSANMDVWETIGGMRIEQLLQQIKNIETNTAEDQAYYHEKLREMQETYSNCDRSIRFLNDFKLPCTTSNLVMAGQILSNSSKTFKKLLGLSQDIEDEKYEKSLKSLKKSLELSDTLIDNDTMTKAYEELEQDVKAIIEDQAQGNLIDYKELIQLKSMGMHMSFLRSLAKREFYQIPIEASGRITNINLTIIRGKESGGKVSVSLLSEKLGSIRAEASLKDSRLSGYIACDHIGSLKILESQTEPLKQVAQEEDITIKQLNFYLQQAGDTIYSYQNSPEFEGDKNPEAERILYRLAKAMIHMIRLAEEADSAVA